VYDLGCGLKGFKGTKKVEGWNCKNQLRETVPNFSALYSSLHNVHDHHKKTLQLTTADGQSKGA